MAFPHHALLSFGGQLGDSDEIWANNIRIVSAIPGPTQPMPEGFSQPILDGLIPVVAKWHGETIPNGGNGYTSRNAKLGWVKFNAIDPLGRYLYPTTYEHDYDPVIRGAASDSNRWRDTVAITWTTEARRGLASKGRIFPPITVVPAAPSPADSAYFSPTTAQQLADIAAGFLEEINDVTYHTMVNGALWLGRVAVVSGVRLGAYNFVNGVEVDRVMDTQRRRTNRVARLAASAVVDSPI